jgi:hypothetical protein
MSTRPSRRQLVDRITTAIRRDGPMILSEISLAARANSETVKSCVKCMVKRGVLIVMRDMRATRTGPAKQYDVCRDKPAELFGVDWIASHRAQSETTDTIMAALDRWAEWSITRPDNAPIHDKGIFWAIEASIKALPVHQAIALLHVHGCSVWVFRRLDMHEVYMEALAVVSRRIEPLLNPAAGARPKH